MAELNYTVTIDRLLAGLRLGHVQF